MKRYNILVSAGTFKEAQNQLVALYDFDSFKDFINTVGKTITGSDANNDGSADGDGGPGKGTKSILPTTERVLEDITHKSF